ncbi:MAG: winged helix-turn-helix transcriptional regulator, partial [Hyphomicrobiales bacterium]|nr:winged helix-turn-helix transcriptional regulator [Hyphomicrobiales bacterium]
GGHGAAGADCVDCAALYRARPDARRGQGLNAFIDSNRCRQHRPEKEIQHGARPIDRPKQPVRRTVGQSTTSATRDAASASARLDALARGTNQSAGRLYNQRLVLSLIRRHCSLPKAEIARQTGLSPQTITIIMRQLEADELVVRRDRQRGRVGQPSVPYALNPDSVLSLGLKIGRRSSDLILIDRLGQRRGAVHLSYAYPTPDGILRFVETGIDQGLAQRI